MDKELQDKLNQISTRLGDIKALLVFIFLVLCGIAGFLIL